MIDMKKLSFIIVLAVSALFVACQGTKADEAITVGEEQDSMSYDSYKKGPIEVNSVDTSDMYVLTDEQSVYLVKERYNIKDDTEDEVWVVKKIMVRDSASAI